MNKLEELEAAYYAAGNTFLVANRAVNTARAIRDAAITARDTAAMDLAGDDVEAAIDARNSARFHMFNAAKALDVARDHKED